MSEATIQFYQNKYDYPDYTEVITPYGLPINNVAPVGVNLKTGTLKVAGDMQDFMSCNYLRIDRDQVSLYAWIDDVRFHTATSFFVDYSVDPLRTYRGELNLGTQFVERSTIETLKRDPLLTTSSPNANTSTVLKQWPNADKRVLTVQVRVESSSELISQVPVQPNPYRWYFIEYDVNDWYSVTPIRQLMELMNQGAKPSNIVTIYSLPYIDTSSFGSSPLPLKRGNNTIHIEGWLVAGFSANVETALSRTYPITLDVPISDLLPVEHSVQIVIPDAGIISVPDEWLVLNNLKIRQDIDLFSGASNYTLMNGTAQYSALSVRGSSIASIQVVGDPLDTYLAQNQNALSTALLGDVAGIVAGGATMMATGGVVGSGQVVGGLTSLLGEHQNRKDIANNYSNAPAFLGTAMANAFSNRFWMVYTWAEAPHKEKVNKEYGYPYGAITTGYIPTEGYIQTRACNVRSNGRVPRWALSEINRIFDSGLRVHLS